MLLGSRNMHLSWTTWGLKMPFRPSSHWPTNWKSLICNTEFYSLKHHAHYFTVLTYLAPWRGAKLGIFIYFTFTNLPWCTDPSCFLWVLHHSYDRTSSYYCCPKKFLYYLLVHVLHLGTISSLWAVGSRSMSTIALREHINKKLSRC